jgi:hypothetical protein
MMWNAIAAGEWNRAIVTTDQVCRSLVQVGNTCAYYTMLIPLLVTESGRRFIQNIISLGIELGGKDWFAKRFGLGDVGDMCVDHRRLLGRGLFATHVLYYVFKYIASNGPDPFVLMSSHLESQPRDLLRSNSGRQFSLATSEPPQQYLDSFVYDLTCLMGWLEIERYGRIDGSSAIRPKTPYTDAAKIGYGLLKRAPVYLDVDMYMSQTGFTIFELEHDDEFMAFVALIVNKNRDHTSGHALPIVICGNHLAVYNTFTKRDPRLIEIGNPITSRIDLKLIRNSLTVMVKEYLPKWNPYWNDYELIHTGLMYIGNNTASNNTPIFHSKLR